MQTRIYQIAYVPPEETTLGADVGDSDTTIELADGQNIQTSGETYLYVGGEFMLIDSIGYEPRFVDVVRGALGTEVKSHSAGEKVFEGEIDPSGSGTDERELRHVDEINNPDIKSLGDIEQSLEYEKAKFRISNTSVSLYDLPKNRLRDAGSIYHPWVVEILDDASNIIFSGIVDGSSVTFNAESRITSFDVLSWLEIMDRAGAVPSRDIYETSIRGSRKSNAENAFFEYPGKGVQIQINDDALPADVATENDVGVIEGDNNEVREFVTLKKSADEVDGDFPVVLLSTSNEGPDDRVVRRFPPSGESSKFNIELLPTPSTSGPGVVYGFNYTDPQGVRELAEIAGTDLSDLSSGLGKKVDLPSGYSVEFELTYTFTKADDTTETVTRQEEITSLVFAMKEDRGPVVELFQGSQTAGGTFIKSIEGNDGGFIRVKRDSATAIVQNLEGGDTIRFLNQNIYGYEGRVLDVGSQDIFNGDYAPRELLDGLFSIEARGTDNRRRLGVLPEVFTGAYKESNQALHNIDGRAQLPSDPLKAVRQIQQKGRFLLKESFTNRTNVDGDPIPGYGVDLILRNNFFDTAEEVSQRKVKSWEEDVATDTVRGVIIKPNEDYFSGRAGPDVDERIGFYFEGIEQYEDPQADDLRERMTPPEGRNVIEIEMPALPSDNIGAIYSGGDSVVENNPRLKEIARFYYEHFRKGAREVNLTFGNDDPEWLGGYYYFKDQGEVIDDYVFVLQETKNVDSTSIDTQIKGRIGADAVNVISPTPTAIIRGPQDISRADSAGNVEVVLRGEDSYSLADNPLRYKWERKPAGGSYSTAQSEGPVLKDSLSGVDSQSEYVYKLTVTDERTGKTDSVTHTLTVGPGQDSPLPGAGSDEFSVQTWQQDGKGYLEIYPVSRVGLDFVRARKKVGGNIEAGQSFSAVSQLSISPQSVDTSANSVVLADDYEEHFAGKPRVYFQRSNGSYSAFDLSSVSYDSSADETTLSLAESISSTDVANVLSGAYIVTVGLTDKHTSTIEVQTRGVLTEKRQTITKTFDFNNLAEVDASVYNDESGAVYADVSGDEDTDTFDLEYRKNGGSWQTELTGQATDIVGYEVVQADSVTDGDNVEVRITPYNFDDEEGSVVLRATFYNRSTGGGAQFDGVTVNGAGTIDSVNTGEFRFRDESGNDAAKIDAFNIELEQINGVAVGNYARTDQTETFTQNVTVQGDLTVQGTEFITNTETVDVTDNLLFLNRGETGNGVTNGIVGFEADRGTQPPVKLIFDESDEKTGRIGVEYKTISYSSINNGPFQVHEEIVGQTSGATAYLWEVDSTNNNLRTKGRTSTFDTGETIEGTDSGATATVDSVSQYDQTERLSVIADSPLDRGVGFWNANNGRFETDSQFTWKDDGRLVTKGDDAGLQVTRTGSQADPYIDFENGETTKRWLLQYYNDSYFRVLGPGITPLVLTNGGKAGFNGITDPTDTVEVGGTFSANYIGVSNVARPNDAKVFIKAENDWAMFLDRGTNRLKVDPMEGGIGSGGPIVLNGKASELKLELENKQNLLRLTDTGVGIFQDPATDFHVDGEGRFTDRILGEAHVQHPSFTAKTNNWAISATGNADFRRVYTDELVAKSFVTDITQALAGSDFLTKSVATLDSEFTIPSQGNTASITVNDLPGQEDTQVFDSGDYVRFRVVDKSSGGLVIVDAWGTVTNYTDNGDGTQTWTFTREDGDTAADGKTVGIEAPVLDYGQDGQGIMRRTVEGPDAPLGIIETWDGDPISTSNYTTHLAYGNLSGVSDPNSQVNPSGWGLYTENGYFRGEIAATTGDILDYLVAGGGAAYIGNNVSRFNNEEAAQIGLWRDGSLPIVRVRGANGPNGDHNFVQMAGRSDQTSNVFMIRQRGQDIVTVASETATISDWVFDDEHLVKGFDTDSDGTDEYIVEQGQLKDVHNSNYFGFGLKNMGTGSFMDFRAKGTGGNNNHMAIQLVNGATSTTDEIAIGEDFRGVFSGTGIRVTRNDDHVFYVGKNEAQLAGWSFNDTRLSRDLTDAYQLQVGALNTFNYATGFEVKNQGSTNRIRMVGVDKDPQQLELLVYGGSSDFVQMGNRGEGPVSRSDIGLDVVANGDIIFQTKTTNAFTDSNGNGRAARLKSVLIEGGASIEGNAVVDGTITANEIDTEDLFATNVTVSGTLTVGDGSGNGVVQSENYDGSNGWRIKGDTAEFQNGAFRGTVNAEGGSLANLEVQGQLTFPSSYDSSQIRIGSGADAFFVGDFSLIGSGQGGSLVQCGASVTDSSPYGDPVTGGGLEAYNKNDIGGASVTVDVGWSSNADSGDNTRFEDPRDFSTSVDITVYVRERDAGTLVQERSKSPGAILNNSGSVSFSFTADSSTDEIEVETELSAYMGQDEEFYNSVSISNGDADLDWTNEQDFVGPDGAIWRENGELRLKIDSNANYLNDSQPRYNDARITVREGSIVLVDADGNEKIRIHPQGYIDFVQQGSGNTNASDFPEPQSGWVRLGAESNDNKMGRKSGNGSANDF